jgi:hypothetical protein
MTKHGFESRRGHQRLNWRDLQHSDDRRQGALAPKAHGARRRVGREGEAADEELTEELARGLHVSRGEPTPILEGLRDPLPELCEVALDEIFGVTDALCRRSLGV